MNRRVVRTRSCWEDRYRTPTVRELLELLTRQHAQLVEHARDQAITLEGVREVIEWRGVPWRWTLAYYVETSPLVFLVPQPNRPRIALPLGDELARSLPLKRASKVVRDAITFAPRVGGVLWPAWDLTTRALTEEIAGLVQRKHELMLSPTA